MSRFSPLSRLVQGTPFPGAIRRYAGVVRSPGYPIRRDCVWSSEAEGSFSVLFFFHCSSINSLAACFHEFRCGPLLHIKVVLDVAVLEHEVLAGRDAGEVLGRQVRHHVHVLDALVGVFGVAVKGLAVEDHRCGLPCDRWPSAPP